MSCIRLISIKYSERLGESKEWVLDNLPLSQGNLLVGKNATVKTIALNIIASLAKLLTSTPRFMINFGSYDVLIDDDGVTLRYKLTVSSGNVKHEEYFIGDKKVSSPL